MRFFVLLLSFILLPIAHGAVLKGVNGVEVLALDGQEVNSLMLENKNINIADGEHQVVVKFAKRINQQNMVYSRPTIFSVNVVGDTEIKVRNFRDVNQAESAVRKGLTWIVVNNKETVEISNADELFKEGFQINPNLEKLIVEYNQKNGLSSPALVAQNGSQSVADINKSKVINNTTQQLISIYKGASLEEKKAFRMWLLEQDIK